MESKQMGKKQILIVEDDEKMRWIYGDFFQDQTGKYEVDMVDNGVTAYKKLQEKVYDVVVLDMIMEKLTGDSLFAIMRDSSKNQNTPVIIVSVLYASDFAVDFILNKDRTAFLQKPITKELLFAKIEAMT